MKKLLVLFLLAISAVFLTSCKSNKEGLIKEGVLKVATSPDYAPYEFVDLSKTGQEKFLGSDVELMKFIAEKMGVKLEIVEMQFDAALMAVQTGNVDIAIEGLSWTPKRAQNFELSLGYYGSGDGDQQVLILKENLSKFPTLESLNKSTVKVGAQAGSIQEEYVDAQLPKAKKELITDLDVALSLLLNKKIDALAISSNAADVRISKNDNLTVVPENFVGEDGAFVVAARKGNKLLINQINEIIQEVLENNLYPQWLEEATRKAIELGEEINE